MISLATLPGWNPISGFDAIQRRTRSLFVPTLNDHELKVLELIGRGKGGAAMAKCLRLDPRVVAAHTASIRRKLQLDSNADLARFAAFVTGREPAA